MFRRYVNDVLKKANDEGILRVNEIVYHSQVGSYIKNELELRLKEAK